MEKAMSLAQMDVRPQSSRTGWARRHVDALWATTTALLTVLIVAVSTWIGTVGGALLLLVALVLIFVIAFPRFRVATAYALGILLIVLAASNVAAYFASEDIFALGSRVAGFALLIAVAVSRRHAPGDMLPVRRSVGWLAPLGIGLAVYLVVGAGVHGQITALVLYTFGLVLLLTTAVTQYKNADDDLRLGLIAALVVVVSASLVTGVMLPSIGIEGGRLRGIMENANSLGFFAFLLGVLGLLAVRSSGSRALCLVLAVAALIGTASRASALALLLVVALLALRKGLTIAIGALVVAGGTAATIYLLAPTIFDPLATLLRLNDSRSGSIATALAAYESSPLVGVGLGNESSIIASSPFRALAQAGIFGLLGVLLMWVAMLGRAVRRSYALSSVAIAAVVHSFFEGWLLSPVSPLLAVFILLWVVIDKAPQGTSKQSAKLNPQTLRKGRA
jgi:hypothetical protein